jgi:hypothetical protein
MGIQERLGCRQLPTKRLSTLTCHVQQLGQLQEEVSRPMLV